MRYFRCATATVLFLIGAGALSGCCDTPATNQAKEDKDWKKGPDKSVGFDKGAPFDKGGFDKGGPDSKKNPGK